MDGSTRAPSPQLLAANQRLLALRRQLPAACRSEEPVPVATCNTAVAEPVLASTDSSLSHVAKTLSQLPPHLGWGSVAVTAVLRRQMAAAPEAVSSLPPWPSVPASAVDDKLYDVSPATNQVAIDPRGGSVKLYPDIGLGMLRQERAASGRLWLLARYLDTDGRGSIRIANLITAVTVKGSPLYLCGKRQLRNLLHEGESLFWHRDKETLWLHSAAKVAAALEVTRLAGRPVALPASVLLAGVGLFRAHLYAAFHSGRAKETVGGELAMPIARDTLAGLSGVGRSSQRVYEARLGLDVQTNFAVGQPVSEERRENYAWKKGPALFELKDYRGRQGKKGKHYLAWQLPNSYRGQHAKRPKGRQKRINRTLKDLVMKGMPGNVGGADGSYALEKVYFPDGKLAAKAYGRMSADEVYWKRGRGGHGRFDLWQAFARG